VISYWWGHKLLVQCTKEAQYPMGHVWEKSVGAWF
jgi:hypothetical protein